MNRYFRNVLFIHEDLKISKFNTPDRPDTHRYENVGRNRAAGIKYSKDYPLKSLKSSKHLKYHILDYEPSLVR